MKEKADWLQSTAKAVVGILFLCSATYFAKTYYSQVYMGESRPRIACVKLDMTKFDFGKAPPGTELLHHFTVSNVGTQRLVLNPVDCGCGESPTGNMIVLPGDEVRIPVGITVRHDSERQTRTLEISTSDPDKPRIELLVIAEAAI